MEKPIKGEAVKIISEAGQFTRKILWVGDNHFEWRGGWGKINQLEFKNLKGRTRFVFDMTKQQENGENS